ncbi:hypothetical protein JFJ09_05195 [Pseudoalteromonas arctica]|uniref:hypothetical protein n=1 Tax=Pseudoalteromonas arctica TaxID=394751 RepID=UPI001C9BE3C8|nr:hypothetical protein [Pseudoalteromonas arctica]MBZ2191608.1 hypothetical protein [Pseudoalteromonas arctica]
MKHLPILIVCLSLFMFAVYEKKITNPSSTTIEVEYQEEYAKKWQKGHLDETDISELKALENRYINSEGRNSKFKTALGYKLLLALLIAFWSFICCRWVVSNVTILKVTLLGVFVLLTFIPFTGVISSTFYAIFCATGSVLALEYKKKLNKDK